MAYETKIPSTRYVCALANVKGQWMIQMRLGGIVEAQTVVKDLSERGIRDNVRTVLSEVDLYIGDFLVEQIVKDLVNQAKILLQETVTTSESVGSKVELSALESSLEEIKTRLITLEERVQRLESVLEHRS
ncbi:MAG: hypothetical protein ACTSQE_10460 [Candidatus Heimdallarchaeaceae archaeon]